MGERICGNCGDKLEKLNETDFYCAKCDETFTIKAGKQAVAIKKNVIEQLKDIVKEQAGRIEKLEKAQEEDETLAGF